MEKIITVCNERNDECALTVHGRIEYFSGDLHAADCLYHHACDVNFRIGGGIPHSHHTKHCFTAKKVGRPKDNDQEQVFSRMCQYFEMNDDEQLTITELASKMKEFLKCTGSLPYGNQYLKFKPLEKYGDSLYIAEGEGLHAIVTLREETSRIILIHQIRMTMTLTIEQ